MASMVKPEAPRSSPSNGLADSYIGSLISLTSKSDIRYEGLFYNINTEESTIGLTNVRSFGTEGRKKDGPQVCPSDKVYDYILFKARDIKDLKVISSPPVQPTTTSSVFNDPAIVQTHNPQVVNPSTNVQPPTFQSNLPSYQPAPNLTPPPSLPNPSNNTIAPMYYPGYFGSSNGFQQQQSLLTPPPPLGLSVPPSPIQQTQHLQQPQSQLALPPGLLIPSYYGSGPSGISGLNSSQSPSALLPVPSFQLSLPPQSTPLASDSLNTSPSAFLPIPSFQSSVTPAQSSALNLPIISESSTYLVPSQAPPQPLNKPAIQSRVSDKPIPVPEPITAPIVGASSSVLNEGAMPGLMTPDQLSQLGPSSASLAQLPQSVSQTDSEATMASLLPPLQTSQTSPESQSLLSSKVARESHGPLLPLPTPAEYKSNATNRHHQPRNNYRGGSHRGRGNMMSQPVNRFTEEFDFIAMNEKFNKDEVWGDIGKNMKAQEDGTESHDDDDGLSKPESNPVYVKDDFFDSLSCNSLDRGAQNGRYNFSQQRRRDTETFGFVPRHNRGGGQGRGGYGQGRGSGYYGRGGNGYVGRGRGGHSFLGRGS